MVYFDKFDEFAIQAKALFLSNPDKTRYTITYRIKESRLVLKVTDNRACLKYKTDQQMDLKRIEKLTCLFVELMSTKNLDSQTVSAVIDSNQNKNDSKLMDKDHSVFAPSTDQRSTTAFPNHLVDKPQTTQTTHNINNDQTIKKDAKQADKQAVSKRNVKDIQESQKGDKKRNKKGKDKEKKEIINKYDSKDFEGEREVDAIQKKKGRSKRNKK